MMRGALIVTLAASLGACGGIFGGGGKKNDTPTVGNRIPILSRINNSAEVDPALAGLAVILPPAQANSGWTQAGGSASKAYGHLALSDAPARAFTAQVAGSSDRRRLAAAPVVGNGRLYVMDTDGRVTVFDARTGARAWAVDAELSEDLRPSAFGGGVSFADGKVYAANGAGDVIAMDANTGAQIWKVRPGGPLRGAPTIEFGNVFVMTQDNQIFALNTADGSPVWNEGASATAAGVFGVAAPAAAQGTVVAGYSSGELVAYRYENGRSLWADALARTSISTSVGSLTDIDADPIIENGRVFALGQGGRMAAYELVTGQRLWELNLAGISTPAVAGEWIFTLTDDGRMLAISKTSGKVRWITQLPQWRDAEDKKGAIFWQGPVLAGNNLWIVNSQGEVYKVSTGEGTATLFTKLDAPISLAPIVADNMLYVLDDSGKINAFR